MKIYDISKLLDKKTAIYPGNPKFEIQKVKEINKDGYNLSSFSMGTHFGTHLDSPLHFIEGGEDISSIDLSYLVGYCNVLNLENVVSCIRKEDLGKLTIDTNIVVLKTKNSNVPYNKFIRIILKMTKNIILSINSCVFCGFIIHYPDTFTIYQARELPINCYHFR